MGSIRLLLALSVVLYHAHVTAMVGGMLAVQMFYAISGYLISYILAESKNYATIKDFYVNRWLRIYPVYYVVALFTIMAYLIFGIQSDYTRLSDVFGSLNVPGTLFLMLTNILIFGQDMVMFMGIDAGHVIFTGNYYTSDPPLYMGLVVPQAWTLSLEITFYILAPFLLRRRVTLVAAFTAAIFVRYLIYRHGLVTKDPWSYRFFPAELGLFVAGALSHRFLAPLAGLLTERHRRTASIGTTLTMTAVILAFPLVPSTPVYTLLAFALLVLLLPLLFFLPSFSAIDKSLGALSYPVYISHVLVIAVMESVWPAGTGTVSAPARIVAVVLAVLLISQAIERYVNRPIEAVRQRNRNRATKLYTTSASAAAIG